MSITVNRQKNGNLVVTIGVGDHVEIRAESIEVQLDDANNLYTAPKDANDVDSVEVSGKRRKYLDE